MEHSFYFTILLLPCETVYTGIVSVYSTNALNVLHKTFNFLLFEGCQLLEYSAT
jgi:hypothetical protein